MITEKEQRWGQGREVEIQVPLRDLVKQAQQVIADLLSYCRYETHHFVQDHDSKRLEEYKNTYVQLSVAAKYRRSPVIQEHVRAGVRRPVRRPGRHGQGTYIIHSA